MGNSIGTRDPLRSGSERAMMALTTLIRSVKVYIRFGAAILDPTTEDLRRTEKGHESSGEQTYRTPRAMRVPRVRFTMRGMMVAVVVAAVVSGGTVLARRQRVYRARAVFYAQQEQVALMRWQHWSLEAVRLSGRPGERNPRRSDQERRLAEGMVDYSRNRAAYHSLLRVKYERVARYPWLQIDPDPPSSDGSTPP